jgi:hypothetical protein
MNACLFCLTYTRRGQDSLVYLIAKTFEEAAQWGAGYTSMRLARQEGRYDLKSIVEISDEIYSMSEVNGG